jgi:hypothetical protein
LLAVREEASAELDPRLRLKHFLFFVLLLLFS